VFRRSGDQYYVFTISPRTKKWTVLKSSSSALTVLKEGTEESIRGLDAEDILRVDAQGSDFFLHINDRLVGEFNDPDYANGEVGLYVQTIDSPGAHIHFDTLTIRDFEAPQPSQPDLAILYQDDFANPATQWAEKKFDNYFIGYHEPEYYHVEITSPNYKTTVFEPEKRSYDDATIELKVFTVSAKTAADGDFNYGAAFRRSGDQYYAFTISPRTKKWTVLKSSSTALTVLKEGTDESIHDLDAEDVLRVDAQGSDFFFYINDQLVAQVSDSDYAAGEVGLYAQTVDSPGAHIHFDNIKIQEFKVSLSCNVNALMLNVRSGPSTSFSSFAFLSNGDKLEPLGRTSDSTWIRISVEGSENEGWVSNTDEFVVCDGDINLLPVLNP
ncbi:MAG: SH3 domain-containing protein, partial [Anaerolineales bacterium]